MGPLSGEKKRQAEVTLLAVSLESSRTTVPNDLGLEFLLNFTRRRPNMIIIFIIIVIELKDNVRKARKAHGCFAQTKVKRSWGRC